MDDQNSLKTIKLEDTYALFSHWNSVVLWFYVLRKTAMRDLRRGSENRQLVSQWQPDSSGLSATWESWPPSHSCRELGHDQFVGRRWAGCRHRAEDGSCCCPLEPSRRSCPGCSSTRHWDQAAPEKRWPQVFIDCAAKCHHLIPVRFRFSLWYRPCLFFRV